MKNRFFGVASADRRITAPAFVLALFAALSTASPAPQSGAGVSALTETSASAPAAGWSTCTLPAPASFDADRTGTSTADLEWSAVSGAVSYRLLVFDRETDELVASATEYGTSKTLGGLEAGKSYRCVLASMCSGGTVSDFVIIEDITDL